MKPFNSVQKKSSGSIKNIIYKMCLEIIGLIYAYKMDFALNNLQWLIRHKTTPNKTVSSFDCVNK